MSLIKNTKPGLYCESGNFHLDPMGKVDTALISHGHADHLRWGSNRYICSKKSEGIVRARLNDEAAVIKSYPYGEKFKLGSVWCSFHPAGHILGSAQIRMETDKEVWNYTGDFKRDEDPTCEPFEVVECDRLISEATFSLPVFRWPLFRDEIKRVYDWWMDNKAQGRPSLIGAYSLGKSQRIIKALRQYSDEEIFVHGAVHRINEAYQELGVDLGAVTKINLKEKKFEGAGKLIVCPPAALNGTWSRRFKKRSVAYTSGWMRVRGQRKRRGADLSAIISDHADWDALLKTFEESKAKKIYLFHTNTEPMIQHLRSQGMDICTIRELGEKSYA